ncbi:MAG: sulfotransferase [Burkholderiales bacterium]|nr:sulfotransferase [Burkholderiales bacterium]MDR4517009.1 sulfotransferase [Nitrosomonas sp.]
MKNVIILTHGWTGSSVFAALLGKAGYWHGENTFKKVDYDTYENLRLVELNNQLLNELNYTGNREHEILSTEVLDELALKASAIDLTPYRKFLEDCQQHKPWIWKDPRLALTIRIWAKFLPLDDTRFIVLTRDDVQAWITSNIRRHIQSRAFTQAYNGAITNSIKKFLHENHLEFIQFKFEDLQLTPEKTVEELNRFLNLQLTMADLKSVYKFPLYKKTRGLKDKLTAWLIYLKNYRCRRDVTGLVSNVDNAKRL